MLKVKIEELHDLLKRALLTYGASDEVADVVANIYVRASYRGVGHHDVYDFFGRLNRVAKGYLNPDPEIKLVTEFGGMACYDGDNGIGEYCTDFATKKSMELAKEHGIGFCVIRNSNHFLAAAPYVEMADEEGFLSLVMSKSPGGLSLPEMKENLMGNNPFGFAAGYDDGQMIFDICTAYSSFGKMRALMREGKEVPEYWGSDKEGQPTSSSKEIFESGLYMPIGMHKGFGLALMVEMFTAVVGGGVILKQDEATTGMKGDYTQSIITIDVSKLMTAKDYRNRTSEMVHMLRDLNPEIYIPGERSNKEQQKIKEQGYFEIEDEVIQKLEEMIESKNK